ncbi:hypothetical protein D3C77_618680 [compost metagenome]
MPVRPAAFSEHPQVRFIGGPDLAGNRRFLAPWVAKVAAWIEQGLAPHVFLHTPDNLLAPALAREFHAALSIRLPGLPPLAECQAEQADEQLGLF